MKLLFIGVFSLQSTNNSQARAFKHLGIQVLRYNHRQKGKELGNKKRDAEIISLCERELPDLVIFSKCVEISVKVFKKCSKITSTVYWYMDPISSFVRNKEVYLDHSRYCTYKVFAKKSLQEYAEQFYDNTYYICEGYDKYVDIPLNVSQDIDVSFIGNPYGSRKNLLKYIELQPTKAFGKKHAEIVSRSKININFCTGGDPSDRVFKVMSSGGFLLTNPWYRYEEDFKDKQDLCIWNTPEELKELINYYLEHEKERAEIALNGQKIVKPYSREDWARTIIKLLVK